MWLRNFVQIILIIASVATGDQVQKCVHFVDKSGFVRLMQNSTIKEHSVISLEFKATNCDKVLLTIHNGENYKLSVNVVGMFNRNDGNINRFRLFDSCNGMWNEGIQNVISCCNYRGAVKMFYNPNYKLETLLDAFQDHPLYIGIHYVNRNYSNYDEPFEGFLRNIKFDGQPLSIGADSLDGTLAIRDCPKSLHFSNNLGSVRLYENLNVNDNIKIYFEMKMTDSENCDALLVSAYSEQDDAYFIVEIVDGVLFMKTKSLNEIEKNNLVFFLHGGQYCDGKWHKIAVLQRGYRIKMVTDHAVIVATSSMKFNFTAPLYIGQHPQLAQISDIESRNGFVGCIRTFHINGVPVEITAADMNEFVQLGNCEN